MPPKKKGDKKMNKQKTFIIEGKDVDVLTHCRMLQQITLYDNKGSKAKKCYTNSHRL